MLVDTVQIESKFKVKLYLRNKETDMSLCIDQDFKIVFTSIEIQTQLSLHIKLTPSDSRTNLKSNGLLFEVTPRRY